MCWASSKLLCHLYDHLVFISLIKGQSFDTQTIGHFVAIEGIKPKQCSVDFPLGWQVKESWRAFSLDNRRETWERLRTSKELQPQIWRNSKWNFTSYHLGPNIHIVCLDWAGCLEALALALLWDDEEPWLDFLTPGLLKSTFILCELQIKKNRTREDLANSQELPEECTQVNRSDCFWLLLLLLFLPKYL